jgi:hypothetical protein
MVLKFTGWPRFRFFHEIYPNARFVWVYRDPVAVVSSLYHVWFWSGWKGPSNWRWGPLPKPAAELWAEYEYSFAVLAALQIRILSQSFKRAAADLPKGALVEVEYERLCDDPKDEVTKVLSHLGLGWHREVGREIQRRDVKSSSVIHERLSDKQRSEVYEVINMPESKLFEV